MDLSDTLISIPAIAKWKPADPQRGTLSVGTFASTPHAANSGCRLYARLEYLQPGRRSPLLQLCLIPPPPPFASASASAVRRRDSHRSVLLAYPSRAVRQITLGMTVGHASGDADPAATMAALEAEGRRVRALAPWKANVRAGVVDVGVAARPVLLKPRDPIVLADDDDDVLTQLALFEELSEAKAFELYLVYDGVLQNEVRGFCGAMAARGDGVAGGIDTESHVAVEDPGAADWDDVVVVASPLKRRGGLAVEWPDEVEVVRGRLEQGGEDQHQPMRGGTRSSSTEADAVTHASADSPTSGFRRTGLELEPANPQGSSQEWRMAQLRKKIREFTWSTKGGVGKGKADETRPVSPDQEGPPSNDQREKSQAMKRVRFPDAVHAEQMADDFLRNLQSEFVESRGGGGGESTTITTTITEPADESAAARATAALPAAAAHDHHHDHHNNTTTAANSIIITPQQPHHHDLPPTPTTPTPTTTLHTAIILSGPPPNTTPLPTDDDADDTDALTAAAKMLPGLWRRWTAWVAGRYNWPGGMQQVERLMAGAREAAEEGEVGGFVGEVVGVLMGLQRRGGV
ncbi:hypothetical protein SLS58_010896 [Diplodia intermedia]|uniref:Uncharacterized protein n=1 Tax=Diplodia intermedia TaxID=856260 RepID=A0ABR3T2W0_9PEZI